MKLLHTRPQPGHALRGNGRCPPALTQEAFYATRNLLTRQRAVLAAVRSEKKINFYSAGVLVSVGSQDSEPSGRVPSGVTTVYYPSPRHALLLLGRLLLDVRAQALGRVRR